MYWRMQLHPDDPKRSVFHAIACLGAGYIGLDFRTDSGDLMRLSDKKDLPDGQHDCWNFAHSMMTGDIVLIMAHHFPVALVRVEGDYNYIHRSDPQIGWFRHFRRVKVIGYYADYVTDALSWQRILMMNTILALRNKTSASYRLIQKWLEAINEPV
jgi:hypothetical protein